jgi:hypothetical protein
MASQMTAGQREQQGPAQWRTRRGGMALKLEHEPGTGAGAHCVVCERQSRTGPGHLGKALLLNSW